MTIDDFGKRRKSPHELENWGGGGGGSTQNDGRSAQHLKNGGPAICMLVQASPPFTKLSMSSATFSLRSTSAMAMVRHNLRVILHVIFQADQNVCVTSRRMLELTSPSAD